MRLRDWLLFLLLGLLWGSSFFWIKIAVQEVGPFTLVAWRLLLAAAGMAVAVLLWRPAWPRGRLWLHLAAFGLVDLALPFVLISWGEQTVDSAVASVLNSTVPIFTVVVAHFALADDRLTWGRVGGVLLGFAGVLVLMGRDLGPGALRASLLGQVAILVAAFAYGVGGVYARWALRDLSPVMQAFVPIVVADLFIWPGALALEKQMLVPALPLTWVALAWLGLLSSCVAYLLFFDLVHAVGPTRTSMVTYLIALVGVLLGVVFLQERLDWHLALGTALVVGAIALVNGLPGRGQP